MNRRRNHAICLLFALFCLFSAGCHENGGGRNTVPEGMVQVNFRHAGSFGAPFSDLPAKSGRPSNAAIPEGYEPGPIEDNTTLWVAVYKGKPGDENPESVTVKSYRVSGNDLIPCQVDAEGNPLEGYDTPLYLEAGSYFFRALGPARELVHGDGFFGLYIDNGDWVIANDERYAETAGNATAELTEENPDCVVWLKPLIHQTARLKFTIYSADDDPFVHSVKMQPVGVELSGLQNAYAGSYAGRPWNWTLCSLADTLIAYPGFKNTIIYLKNPVFANESGFSIETPVLPTDAVATPIIVLFNVEVNGNPTQFQMLLNRKIFRAGYSYHYRGRVTLKEGVTVMDWESVSWNADIPFF